MGASWVGVIQAGEAGLDGSESGREEKSFLSISDIVS